jgi:hypothetical protein
LRTIHTELLEGLLALPEQAQALVILNQSNKSKQQTLVNKWVSFVLDAHGFATLRRDLELQSGLHEKFQLDLMAQRLELATQ